MRKCPALLAVFVVALASGADSPKEYNDAATVAGIDGTWRLVSLEVDGRPERFESRGTLTYWAGRFTWPDGSRGTYRIDPSTNPAQLDETASAPEVVVPIWRNLYQRNGDTLRIACTLDQTIRPTSFAAAKGLTVFTYERVKK